METIDQLNPITGRHVVAMPFPGRGHINPMINLCTLLIPSPKISTITLILTEEWLGLVSHHLPPAAASPKLRLRSIPNVLPSERTRGADFSGFSFYRAVDVEMEAPFEELLLTDDLRPVSCIVYDVFLRWVPGVGSRRNIPVVGFWTQAPSVFSVYYQFDLIADRGHVPVKDNLPGKEQEIIDYFPGVPPMRLTDLPSTILRPTQILNVILEAFSLLTKAQSIIFTSFYELQPNVISALRPILPIPIYTIGPSIPFLSLKTSINEEGYMKWLNSQPEASVLYVSLGSFLSPSTDQMKELSSGLRASGARYLWIVRADQESSFGAACCEEKGFTAPWCDQLRVLCHRSVGGFLTHCGWNSTMESVFAGVPMLALPLRSDQVHNGKIIAEDLGVGVRLKRVVGLENVIGREEIAETVKRFMDLNEEESKEMRRRAKELQETCHRAVEAGGSTDANVNDFLESLGNITS
ncbi:hypothetical protein RHSIM_Rhsim03G0028200 [Rhododendron simsii]|uniref:Glycosyltransferase n=1 Tax=Rhododendron simsii TaxID=118357 RepID=A0A834H3K3_RHOSS|nr:hypothetical protein RHSIM_Rhsim03G0028200 [Rhododendron simsii]